jgi:hypothetical protein
MASEEAWRLMKATPLLLLLLLFVMPGLDPGIHGVP